MFWEYFPIPRFTFPRLLVAAGLLAGLFAILAPRLRAAEGAEAAPPTATQQAREDYSEFLRAENHRAFAVGPGGSWGMATDASSLKLAEAKALDQCQAADSQNCLVYAADGKVVLDQAAWLASWRPSSAVAAARARSGTEVGDRFPDFVVTGPDGARRSLADFHGQVVVLHFWGSWCGICQRELPELSRLYQRAASIPGLRFVPVQAREPIAASQRWAAAHDIHLPLYDGGGTDAFRLANGRQVSDRSLAHNYPSTYVLDQNGVVVFRHIGELQSWGDYLPLLAHLAATGESRTASR